MAGMCVLVTACGKWGDKAACGEADCMWSQHEWDLISGLAHVTTSPPPVDVSNGSLRVAATLWDAGADTQLADPVVRLGWLLYHDPRLSGSFSDLDSLGRPAASLRRPGQCAKAGANQPDAPVGPLVNVSCASCHNPKHNGSDNTSETHNVSSGAGFYDVNAQQTLNVARFDRDDGTAGHYYWNGRSDSLWAQAAQVMESPVSMNGHRLRTFWVISKYYSGLDGGPDLYGNAFPDKSADAAGDVSVLAADPAFKDLQDLDVGDLTTTKVFKTKYGHLSAAQQRLVERVHVNAAKAIATYEWFLNSDNSRFDQFVQDGPSSGILSPSERRGLKLFVGRASCIQCHNTPLFSDGNFHNIGIPQAGEHVPTTAECTATTATGQPKCFCPQHPSGDGGIDGGDQGGQCLPWGAYSGLEKLRARRPDAAVPSSVLFRRGTCFDDQTLESNPACEDGGTVDPDAGVVDVGLQGTWRTPSLRDVAMTGPYMHDGIFQSLADVVWHYDQGGMELGVGSNELAPLLLSEQDRLDLVAFLQTLTGTPGPPGLIDPPDADLQPHCDAGAGN